MPYKIQNTAVDFTALTPDYTGSSIETYKAMNPYATDPYNRTSGDRDGSTTAKAFNYGTFDPPGGTDFTKTRIASVACVDSPYLLLGRPVLVPIQTIFNQQYIVGFMGFSIYAHNDQQSLRIWYASVYGPAESSLSPSTDYFNYWVERSVGGNVSYYNQQTTSFSGSTKITNQTAYSSPSAWIAGVPITYNDDSIYTLCIRPTIHGVQGVASIITVKIEADAADNWCLKTIDQGRPYQNKYYLLPYDSTGTGTNAAQCPLWGYDNF